MRKYCLSLLLILFLFTGLTSKVYAVSASPEPIKIKQPDGTEITLYIRGDEFYNWFEDEEGYTTIKNEKTKEWTYAEKDSFGEIKPSENVVGKVSPKKLNIQKSLKDDYEISKVQQTRKSFDSMQHSVAKVSSSDDSVQKIVAPTGTKTNFVLLIQFRDLKFTDNPPFTSSSETQIRNIFSDLFNKAGYNADGAVGSVRDYFKEVSYGALDNYTSVISPIITIDQDHAYYADANDDAKGSRVGALIKDALEKLHSENPTWLRDHVWPDTSITEPEGFTVIHAGGGAEAGNKAEFIWSHAQYFRYSVGSTVKIEGITFDRYHTEAAGRGYNGDQGLVRIGVICHESLHFFGLPDLYDTTYASAGLGAFSIMASGSWNGLNTADRDGKCPAHPDAWCKYTLGWITPQMPYEGINNIGNSAEDSSAYYKLKSSSAGFPTKEYFLMENRQATGFDRGLPGSKRGILIYHIDETQDNNDNRYRYLVDIEEADGTADWTRDHLATNKNELGRDSDYYRSGTVTVFSDTCVSSPNSKSYSGKASGINIAGITASSSNMKFAYGDVVIFEDLDNVISYPNPARNGYMYITNLPISSNDFSAEVFTIKGNLVKSFSSADIDFVKSGDTILGKIKWLLKNDKGENVAPGVYIVMIKANDKIKKYKVAVIR